jgi:hypothetical protein
VLIGFRPAELMLGRFLPLLVGGTAFAALVGVAMTPSSSPTWRVASPPTRWA